MRGTRTVRLSPSRPNSTWGTTWQVTYRSPAQAAVAARGATPLESDALTVVDAGRHAHLDLPWAPLDAGAPARGARVVDDDPSPGTRCTGWRRRTGPGCPPRRRARCTRHGRGEVPGLAPEPEHVEQSASDVRWSVVGHAADGILEVERQLGLQVGARWERCRSPRPRCGRGRTGRGGRRRPRHRRRTRTRPRPTVPDHRAEAAGHRAEATHLVVLLATCFVAEHVRGRDLLEAILGLGVVPVGVRWYCRASFRYALVMSLADAPSSTPSTE